MYTRTVVWPAMRSLEPELLTRPIRRIHCTAADRLAEAGLGPSLPAPAAVVDYASVVVNKPWGYEYQLYDNGEVSVWILSIRPGASTSLHCHRSKLTSLVVLAGRVATCSLKSRFTLGRLDGVSIDAGAFHSTRATDGSGAFVLEIETPSLKCDVVRLRDEYGRQLTAYEGTAAHSAKLDDDALISFPERGPHARQVLRGTSMCLERVERGHLLSETGVLRPGQTVGLCAGAVADGSGAVVLSTGAICRAEALLRRDGARALTDLELLTIGVAEEYA